MMLSEEEFLGCNRGVDDLRTLNDRLSAKVVEQLNESQELAMINSFARETSEYQFKTSLQDRISDIASWRWVFEDLSKRLDDATAALNHEHKALRVVIQRIESEIKDLSANKHGAMIPMTDPVEKVLLEEHRFLIYEKKNFQNMISELEKQINSLVRTLKRIQDDILKKQEALSIENACANIELNCVIRKNNNEKKRRKRFSSLTRWENRCVSLKRIGLQALANAVVTRQQVRGARVRLSIASQAHASKVDAALRKRVHANAAKLEEISWQREEAIRDITSLKEELTMAEQNLLETMEQERLAMARLADRTQRPPGEATRDQVDRKLRDELGRLRHFMKHLRSNIDRITSLQNRLAESITRMDCYAEDISHVLHLDQERMSLRLHDDSPKDSHATTSQPASNGSLCCSLSKPSAPPLASIKEEEEDEDDYPFDD